MSIKNDLDNNIKHLSSLRKYQLLCILQEISQLMVDEVSCRFDGASLIKEYKTKNMNIRIIYGKTK